MSTSNSSEDLVNRVVGWQSTIEDVEPSLEALRDVVSTPARMDHGCNDLDVDNVCELSGFLQVVETSVLHHLSCDLIGHLD